MAKKTKKIKVRDLKPKKDAKGGGGRTTSTGSTTGSSTGSSTGSFTGSST